MPNEVTPPYSYRASLKGSGAVGQEAGTLDMKPSILSRTFERLQRVPRQTETRCQRAGMVVLEVSGSIIRRSPRAPVEAHA